MNVATLSQVSLQPPASFPELYVPLWWYSGNFTQIATTAGYACKGGNGLTSASDSRTTLLSLSTNESASQKYALEATVWNSSSSGTTTVYLYDKTTSTAVPGSTITTSTTTATVMRTSQFTLTPGHQYAVYVASNSTSYTAYITDASIIIFPPSPSISPSLSSISLVGGSSLKEAYIPLWVYSSGTVSTTATGYNFLQKGSTSLVTTSNSSTTLYALNSSWNPNQKFAVEASGYSSVSGQAVQIFLYDFNTSNVPSGASFGIYQTSATVTRSGSFTLTPGHNYGIAINSTSTGATAYLTKAHLVALSS